jgi:hypothetical protein
MVIGEEFEEGACALALQNLGQDAPRTDWDRMSQLRGRGHWSRVSSHWGRRKKQLLQILPHSKFKITTLPSFAFLRVHSRFKNSLKDSALRGRIALPGEEVPRKMRGTAGKMPALPF